MSTTWLAHLLQVLSGALITNSVPHLVQGLSGAPFQSPFASPPGVGESSPIINFYWGFLNLVGGLALLTAYGPASTSDTLGCGLFAAGALLIGTQLALHFGKVRAKGDR